MPRGLAETATGCYLPSKAFTPALEVAGLPFLGDRGASESCRTLSFHVVPTHPSCDPIHALRVIPIFPELFYALTLFVVSPVRHLFHPPSLRSRP